MLPALLFRCSLFYRHIIRYTRGHDARDQKYALEYPEESETEKEIRYR